MDVDYPPYTAIGEDLSLSGFSPDFVKGLEEICYVDIELVQASWAECWGSDKIGPGLLNANYHGCAAYTHTKGVRNRYLEFTKPILAMNKAAGILTRLENGEPVVSGSSNLSGVTVGDVTGWAPTSDVLATSTNQCTDQKFSDFTIMKSLTEKPNDDTLIMLLDGIVDAVWIYADQADKYSSACGDNPNQDGWDCRLWSKFGIEFAYIQTGIYDYMQAGTTFATSKKGSGLAKTLDPCISEFLKKKKYKDLCYKYGMENDCFQNQHFNITTDEVPHYSKPTRELNTTCADGYCPCNVAKPSAMPTGTPSNNTSLAPSNKPSLSPSFSNSPSSGNENDDNINDDGSGTRTSSGTTSGSPTPSPTDVPTSTLAPTSTSTTIDPQGFNSKEELERAVDLWQINENSALSQYGEIDDWDVSQISNMNRLFYNKQLFNEDLSRWNVAAVTDMGFMFSNARAFNSNISDWSTSNVTHMLDMFSFAHAFNSNISDWVTSNVTNMGGMFYKALAFDQVLCWDLSKVSTRDSMFDGAKGGSVSC